MDYKYTFQESLKPQLYIHIAHKSFPSFLFFGIIGYILGVLTCVLLSWLVGYNPLVVGLIGLTAALTFFALALFWKIISGEENLVYYQHEIAILLTSTGLLYLLDEPILPYLDFALLGVGIFLAFGRIGCYSVGCCHGKPHKKGVIYSYSHAEAGFERYLVGVPLFPIQLVESFSVFFIVLVGISFFLLQYPPGLFLSWYTLIYGVFRFTFEFFRGDLERPYWGGLSEAQWTTLGLVIVVSALELFQILPFYPVHIIIGWSFLIIVLSKIYLSHSKIKLKIWHPFHIKEIADIIKNWSDTQQLVSTNEQEKSAVKVQQTSLSIKISYSQRLETKLVHHIALSSSKYELSTEIIISLARLFQVLKFRHLKFNTFKGQRGVHHIIFS